MDELERRLRQAAEAILENERLTTDLDDEVAQDLLDWGIDAARQIISGSVDLPDFEAEQVTGPRLRALRRMLRQVNRWAAESEAMDTTAAAEQLDKLVAQAAVVYGADFTVLADDQRATCLDTCLARAGQPRQIIAGLRQALEPATPAETNPAPNSGVDDDQNTQA